MSELDKKDLINSLKFAIEFLKILRGFKLDNERQDSLPFEIKEYLANEKIHTMMSDNDLEPEMLVWGLVQMVEVLVRYAELDHDKLMALCEGLLEYIKKTRDEEL